MDVTAAERDACGVGFIADVRGRRSHEIVAQSLAAVASMSHRGAVAADGKTGDGAGVLTQLPYALFRRDLRINASDADLAAGMLFLPRDPSARREAVALIEAAILECGMRVLGWRDVPVDPDALGAHALATQPHIAQVVAARRAVPRGEFDRAVYLCRRRIERRAATSGLPIYVPSFSRRTIIYKGLLASPQLGRFYHDLRDPAFTTALGVFHQRYSTNTFPSWELAQPFRCLAHNGEINTLQGNVHWMRAREAQLASARWGAQIAELVPVIQDGGSDSAMLDNVAELLAVSERDLPHALLMLVPQAWEGNPELDDRVRAFYEYHACLSEPWDGPAALAFSDGVQAGAVLDRNGLRPARYLLTEDGLLIMASEAGVLHIPPQRIREKGRLGPGEMLIVDTAAHRVLRDADVKGAYARRRPYREWVRRHMVHLGSCPPDGAGGGPAPLVSTQRAFGWTAEDLEQILRPMIRDGKDPVFSMGDDTPSAVLSTRPRLLYSYFKQRFAQVTNPAIDPLRERLVMSLAVYVGPRPSFLEETPVHAAVLHLRSPVLLPEELRWLREEGPQHAETLTVCVAADEGEDGFARSVGALVDAACEAALRAPVIILSDRDVDAGHAPLPMLLAVAAVHHGLIRAGVRMRTSLVVETGEARDIHHLACLLGYGAAAVCPYLVYQALAAEGDGAGSAHERWVTYRRAAEAGLLKIMSKMGISTLSGYSGAQIFEAVGLDGALVAACFPGTPSRIEGIGLPEIARETLDRHRQAFGTPEGSSEGLAEAGYTRFRRDGEYHAFNPHLVKAAHDAFRRNDPAMRAAFTRLVETRPPTALRDLLEFVPRAPIPVDDVEPVEAIVRRFVISAMSHGALSLEAHTALAIAANRIGARSNSGEGGEDPARYRARPDGESANSRIKQIASARFGVTPEYILSADELEIKIAQGSKPGEGGQLPGHKVSAEIARIRRAQPGSTLISPAPHHDIYSIEDLAQLIYDLKRIHPRARVSVKLVSEAGVGTVAAGVAKAYADTIQISGNDGGTGASPLDSIKNAGVPWELGLTETQQVLVQSGLRARVRLRVDGGLKTGRDIVIAALLGAEEYGFGTAAVVALGCVMARQCHLNTCPVGVATQREDLRAKFTGQPENVIRYLRAVAGEVREILAALGVRSLDEIIGRVDLLQRRSIAHAKAESLDLAFVLRDPDPTGRLPRGNRVPRNDRPDEISLDHWIVTDLGAAPAQGRAVELFYPIRNAHRTVGAEVAGQIAAHHGDRGLPEGTITLEFAGSAGQSFGAFCVSGLALHLEGEANDYVGKGMAGGLIVIHPSRLLGGPSERNVIMGNTVLYGATGGRLFAAGRAGERFAVRNSGAVAVVEGLGDHGCEYMTGGTVVVLGEVGRNFGAGMTGGVAYVLDERRMLARRCNPEHVAFEPLMETAEQTHVRSLIAEHARVTGSPWAQAVLNRWERYAPLFWRVAPREAAARTTVAPNGAAADAMAGGAAGAAGAGRRA